MEIKKLEKYLLMAILVIFLLRITMISNSIGDALSFMSIFGIIGFYLWLNRSRENEIQDLKTRLDEISMIVQAMKLGQGLVRRSVPNESQQSTNNNAKSDNAAGSKRYF